MQIFLTDQTKHFPKHLKALKQKPIIPYNKDRMKEQTSSIDLNTTELNIQLLLDYNIFPDRIMTGLAEWNLHNRPIQVGDIIVQQVYMPPIKACSQKIVFGVRVKEIIDEPHRKGYSYETLKGHVEKGISTFTFEQSGQKCIFKIQTYSAPGNLLTQLIGPIFSRPYQAYSTRQALQHVKQQIENP